MHILDSSSVEPCASRRHILRQGVAATAGLVAPCLVPETTWGCWRRRGTGLFHRRRRSYPAYTTTSGPPRPAGPFFGFNGCGGLLCPQTPAGSGGGTWHYWGGCCPNTTPQYGMSFNNQVPLDCCSPNGCGQAQNCNYCEACPDRPAVQPAGMAVAGPGLTYGYDFIFGRTSDGRRADDLPIILANSVTFTGMSGYQPTPKGTVPYPVMIDGKNVSLVVLFDFAIPGTNGQALHVGVEVETTPANRARTADTPLTIYRHKPKGYSLEVKPDGDGTTSYFVRTHTPVVVPR